MKQDEKERFGGLDRHVGKTPLIRLRGLSEATGCEILGKAEWMNPGGSVKDRAAWGMITSAEADGRLKPGSTRKDESVSPPIVNLSSSSLRNATPWVCSPKPRSRPSSRAAILL